MEKDKIIGQQLKKVRKQLGLTQADITKDGSIISVGQYSKIENGIHQMDANVLFEILEKNDEIDTMRFLQEVKHQYRLQSDRKINAEELSQKLTMHFYNNDLNGAKAVQKSINKLKKNRELKLRAIITVAVLNNTILEIDEDVKKDISQNAFSTSDWTKKRDSLRLFSNAMQIIDKDVAPVLMAQILKTYDDISSRDVQIQERISSICLNFLYTSFKNQTTKNVPETIELLRHLSDTPSLMFNKILGYYFESLFKGEEMEVSKIENLLRDSNCQNFLHKLLS